MEPSGTLDDDEFTLKNFNSREDDLNSELMLKTFNFFLVFFAEICHESLRKGYKAKFEILNMKLMVLEKVITYKKDCRYFSKKGNALPLFSLSKPGNNTVQKFINTTLLAY